jgi:rare lipoprotein A
MKFKNIITKAMITLIISTLFSLSLQAKDPNILAYIDRGIKYYPKYVKNGLTKIGKASWYGKPFHGRLTANGERYNMYKMTAAHRTYAMGTRLKITNLSNRKSVKVRVNDRGPFYSSRDIDLSYGAARKLGMVHKGVGRVKIEVLSGKKSHKKSSRKNRLSKKTHSKKHASKKKLAQTKKVKPHKVTKKTIIKDQRNERIQVASFFNKNAANTFKKKFKLKNSKIESRYIKSKKRTAYRVIVHCTSKEAKKLLNSKKFVGAYRRS